jgi:hypothetical protein
VLDERDNEQTPDPGLIGGQEERTEEKEIYDHTSFFEPSARESLLSFNYSLIQQGFASQVSCIYDRTSPLRFKRVRATLDSTVLPVLQYGGSCNATKGRDQVPNDALKPQVKELNNFLKRRCETNSISQEEQEHPKDSVPQEEQEHSKDSGPQEQDEVLQSLNEMPYYTIEGTKTTLISWVCQGNLAKDSSYAVVYLQKLVSATPVNITCTVWQMRPENYLVTYISSLDYYTTRTLVKSVEDVDENGAPQSTSGTSLRHGYMSYAIGGLSSLISWAQNGDSNLFVDSVESLTSTSDDLRYSGERDLILYQGMIQGILDYKVSSNDLNSIRVL